MCPTSYYLKEPNQEIQKLSLTWLQFWKGSFAIIYYTSGWFSFAVCVFYFCVFMYLSSKNFHWMMLIINFMKSVGYSDFTAIKKDL